MRPRHRAWYFLFGGVAGIAVGVLIARDDGSRARSSTSPTTITPPTPLTLPTPPTPRPAFVGAASRNAPVVEPEVPTTSIVIPVPTRLGGGKPVSPANEQVAERLGLLPTDLADLTEPPGGELPSAVVRRLDDAHARGAALGDRLGLGPSQRELLAGRFANQLVRIERNFRQSPAGTRFDDVVEMVTRDTLEDLRRNLGDNVARDAEPDVRGLKSLPSISR